ncbi:MAG: Eco57I restriction-modification methylase domain-containing protein [Bacteroidetes bacterium]|nr:Eco57I restriction-modification methylase domain-containing protein [Bacteroidota bacterium]
MKLKLIEPKLALNKAFLKEKVLRNDIDVFKKNLNLLLNKTYGEDSEEHDKVNLITFLKDTYYKDKYEINTKDNIDLAIHIDKSSKSNVGVIIEVKRPSNTSEMISTDDFNTRAMHELVLYYMTERVIHKNIYIKNLIAANIYGWFIFSSHEFERLFYNNKKFLKKFEDWNNKQTLETSTPFFYESIVKPFIANLDEEIEAVHFDFRMFKDLLESDNKEDDNKLVSLYKILTPVHLLKESFANDSNTLDTKFYFELLHIMGLEESKEKSKKVIRRKPEGKRVTASFLENTINIIKVENRLNKLKNPENFGKDEEEQLFNVALELCINWINRCLFIKLVEAQILKYHRGNNDYKFLDYSIIPDFDELNKLFFQVLAVKNIERTQPIKEKYEHVPYLNSSLFEISPLEDETIRISSLDDNLRIQTLRNTILKDNQGRRFNGKLHPLDYLFRFLDAYDFTSEGSDVIQEENKTLINASVLGLIFEKINGYKDGSYFTPGFITMYMSRESLRLAVVQKFNDKYNWDIETFYDLKNIVLSKRKTKEIREFNEVVNSFKICDPAVGSGHFLVSVLNEIIAIKSELGILADKDGVCLDIEAHVENDELIFTYIRGLDIFEYFVSESYINKVPDKIQNIQKTIFHEKEIIIENCLFGVDINPNSVNIARLRLWIELLKNAYYTEESKFKELETLPNIDINIKVGNSLISKFNLSGKLNVTIADREAIKQYKQVVNEYKNCTNKKQKEKLKIQIANFKDILSGGLAERSNKFFTYKKLLNEFAKKFKSSNISPMFVSDVTEEYNTGNENNNNSKDELEEKIKKLREEMDQEEIDKESIYRNALEWRFEFPEVLDDNGNFIGFDLIISNPPYGLKLTNNTEYLRNNYESSYTRKVERDGRIITLKGSTDTFSLFIERSMNLLKDKSNFSFIVPLAFTSSESMTALHDMLFNTCEFLKISSYSNRPTKIFDNADQRVSVIIAKKTSSPIKYLYTTNVIKRYTDTPINDIIGKLSFVNSIDFVKYGRLPKVGTNTELSILRKLFNSKNSLKDLMVEENGTPVYYRAAGGRYYNIITNFTTNSSAEKSFLVDIRYLNLIAAILSTNLYYWFYHVYSDTFNMKIYELEIFPIPIDNFNELKVREIEQLYQLYIEDIKKHSKIKKVSYAHISEYTEYYARYSKHIIDKIDLAIKDAYGLTDEEINFIINYDIRFRTDNDEENDDDE